MTISPKQVVLLALDFPDAGKREQISERIRELSQPVKDETPEDAAERRLCIEAYRNKLASM